MPEDSVGTPTQLTRREFLNRAWWLAVLAAGGGAVLAACSPNAPANPGTAAATVAAKPTVKKKELLSANEANDQMVAYIAGRELAGEPVTLFEAAALRIGAQAGFATLAEATDNTMLRQVLNSNFTTDRNLGDWRYITGMKKRAAVFVNVKTKTYVKVALGGAEEEGLVVKAAAEMQNARQVVNGLSPAAAAEEINIVRIPIDGVQRTVLVAKDFGPSLEGAMKAGTIASEQASRVYTQALKAAVTLYEKTGMLVDDVNPGNFIIDANGNFKAFIDLGEKNPYLEATSENASKAASWLVNRFRGMVQKTGTLSFPNDAELMATVFKGTKLENAKILGVSQITSVNIPGYPGSVIVDIGELRAKGLGGVSGVKAKVTEALNAGKEDLVIIGRDGKSMSFDLRPLLNHGPEASNRLKWANAFGRLGRIASFVGDVAFGYALIDGPIQSLTDARFVLPVDSNGGLVSLDLDVASQFLTDKKRMLIQQGKPLMDFTPPQHDSQARDEAGRIASLLLDSGADTNQVQKILVDAEQDQIEADSMPFEIVSKGSALQQLDGRVLESRAFIVQTKKDGRMRLEIWMSGETQALGAWEKSAGGWSRVNGGVPDIEFQGSGLSAALKCTGVNKGNIADGKTLQINCHK